MSDAAFNEAVVHEWSWKTAAMSRMTVAVLLVLTGAGLLALRRRDLSG